MAVPIFPHLFAIELGVFEIVGITHLEHVLEVAVEMHVHFHAVYVLNGQIIAVSGWVHDSASNLLPYQALSSSHVRLLVIAIYAIWINLGVATFETTIFLSHPVIVSKGLQVCFGSALAWYGGSAPATVTCSCHA